MTGCIGEDSANVKQGVEHDHVANTIIGGDESHRIVTLSQMFHVMAQRIKDTKDDVQVDNGTDSATHTKKVSYMLQLYCCLHVYFDLTHSKHKANGFKVLLCATRFCKPLPSFDY